MKVGDLVVLSAYAKKLINHDGSLYGRDHMTVGVVIKIGPMLWIPGVRVTVVWPGLKPRHMPRKYVKHAKRGF